MTASPWTTSRTAVELGLRRVHFAVLGTLASCALVAALAGAPERSPTAGADSTTYAAIALALVSTLARRRRPGSPANVRMHVLLSVVSLLAAAGVGGVGVVASLAGAPRANALAMVLAGAIFALRSPLGIAASSGTAPA